MRTYQQKPNSNAQSNDKGRILCQVGVSSLKATLKSQQQTNTGVQFFSFMKAVHLAFEYYQIVY